MLILDHDIQFEPPPDNPLREQLAHQLETQIGASPSVKARDIYAVVTADGRYVRAELTLRKKLTPELEDVANWLYDTRESILQRLCTQRTFLRYGKPENLRAISKHDLAEAFDVNEETVNQILSPMYLHVTHEDSPPRIYPAVKLFVDATTALKYKITAKLNSHLCDENKSQRLTDARLAILARQYFNHLRRSGDPAATYTDEPDANVIKAWRKENNMYAERLGPGGGCRNFRYQLYSPINHGLKHDFA